MAISSPEMMLVPAHVSYGEAGNNVTRTKVDVTERTATNLAADSILVADTEILPRVSLLRCSRVCVHDRR
jgi:hypothetical protein